jgi:hypothetical protein
MTQLPLFAQRIRLFALRQLPDLTDAVEALTGVVVRDFGPHRCGHLAHVLFDGAPEHGSCRGLLLTVDLDDAVTS